MINQNVGTPRFYINIIEWMASLGLVQSSGGFPIERYFTTNASIPTFFMPGDGDGLHDSVFMPNFGTYDGNNGITYNSIIPDNKGFFAILGHLFKTNDCEFIIQEGNPDYSGINDVGKEVNYGSAGTHIRPDLDGFTLSTCGFNDFNQISGTPYYVYEDDEEGGGDGVIDGYANQGQIRFESGTWDYADANPYWGYGGIVFGSIVIGSYYDMPHGPEMSLTMTREMDGVKRIRTKGGSDLVDYRYTKSPPWGELAAWELHDSIGGITDRRLSRSGRRVWDLSFNYLQDSDVFPDVSSLTNYETISPDGVVWDDAMNATDNTLLDEETFFSQVIHKTNGGQLPFIFQPDNSNFNPDQFAIAKLDMKSFKFDQVANGVYNMKLKIREVW